MSRFEFLTAFMLLQAIIASVIYRCMEHPHAFAIIPTVFVAGLAALFLISASAALGWTDISIRKKQ